ncbi:MAG: exodeoxyribonuclease VII large subunit [Clostridia bacterium]|nr:exodeoxyribonuclease VII large subunit [Clostridia bacterium]
MNTEPKIATVSQINGYIKKILDSNVILNDIWIKGEISNFKLHYSGHMYITLKDEGGVLKAVMFKSAASKLAFVPEDGMMVLARGRISVYEQGGSYQLYITEMTPDGVGDLYIAFEQMKKRLEQEGLFDAKFKKPIPEYPECVGVVTAATGAAVRDIINVITRRYPYAKILLYPALVQGQGAAESVSQGIELFNRLKCADVLIVGRGGGSIEDLWAFNEERTARAIFASEIPVISAVGHETDFTIADFVADLRAPTPSAAAELAVPSQTELLTAIATDRIRMNNYMTRMVENLRLRVSRLEPRNPIEKYDILRQRIDDYLKLCENSFDRALLKKRRNMGELAAKLDALSPLKVMSRGFSLATDDDGNVIKSIDSLSEGMELDLRLYDGKARCSVTKCEKGV